MKSACAPRRRLRSAAEICSVSAFASASSSGSTRETRTPFFVRVCTQVGIASALTMRVTPFFFSSVSRAITPMSRGLARWLEMKLPIDQAISAGVRSPEAARSSSGCTTCGCEAITAPTPASSNFSAKATTERGGVSAYSTPMCGMATMKSGLSALARATSPLTSSHEAPRATAQSCETGTGMPLVP